MTESVTRDHLANAKLYANRDDMIAGLGIAPGGAIAEIGVALGDFSEVLLRTLRPKRFTAIDLFTLHEYPMHWGRTPEELFGKKTHKQYFQDRFAGQNLEILEGLSFDCIPKMADKSYDLIYIDADHRYEGVRRDTELSIPKVKDTGFLVFNDYIMHDHIANTPYGVVPVVNEILNRGDWKIVGFALQRDMFCDIALARPAAGARPEVDVAALREEIARLRDDVAGLRASTSWRVTTPLRAIRRWL